MMQGEVRAGRRGGVGAKAARAVCTGRAQNWRLEVRAGAGRTRNTPLMIVTLEVSKLSGWLNATARCQVKCRVCEAG